VGAVVRRKVITIGVHGRTTKLAVRLECFKDQVLVELVGYVQQPMLLSVSTLPLRTADKEVFAVAVRLARYFNQEPVMNTQNSYLFEWADDRDSIAPFERARFDLTIIEETTRNQCNSQTFKSNVLYGEAQCACFLSGALLGLKLPPNCAVLVVFGRIRLHIFEGRTEEFAGVSTLTIVISSSCLGVPDGNEGHLLVAARACRSTAPRPLLLRTRILVWLKEEKNINIYALTETA
jgi:hypothetical protein